MGDGRNEVQEEGERAEAFRGEMKDCDTWSSRTLAAQLVCAFAFNSAKHRESSRTFRIQGAHKVR